MQIATSETAYKYVSPLVHKAIIVDDEDEWHEEIGARLKEIGINAEAHDTFSTFQKAINNSSIDDIIMADNYMQGVWSIKANSGKEFDTSDGTAVGWVTLTKIFQEDNLNAGLRLLVSQHKITEEKRKAIAIFKELGHNISAYRKNNIDNIINKILNFTEAKHIQHVSHKLNYAFNLAHLWELTEQERVILFDVKTKLDALNLLRDSQSRASIEATCDAIYTIKMYLRTTLRDDRPDLDTIWLREKISLFGDLSPLELIAKDRSNGIRKLLKAIQGP